MEMVEMIDGPDFYDWDLFDIETLYEPIEPKIVKINNKILGETND